jgi:hypothetical protein
MNIIDLRKKLLQSSTEKRVYADRRKVSYQFGSPEWLEYTKNYNIECPTEDRRKIIRREKDRENNNETEVGECATTYRRIFLTAGEKRLLQDIYLSDID